MPLDPRTPVLIGGGQLNQRDAVVEPVDMIVSAARSAAEDAGNPDIVTRIDSIRLVRMLSWKYANPGLLVGERLGASVRHTGYTGDGGNAPQALVSGAAADIAAGRADVVLVGGAEAWRTRMKLRAEGARPDWTVQADGTVAPEMLIPQVPMVFPGHKKIGLDRPAYVYPLFEEALRSSAGRSAEDHRSVIGNLWSRFSAVAAGNPFAWSQQARSADEIITPASDNRMVTWPYTKLLNSNNMVEQAAAVLVCSVEAAERAGIARDRWVFIHSAADAHDTYDITERGALDTSPAIRIAGRRALELAGLGIDDVGIVDLYSCFPSAVQVAAAELGLSLDDANRPLTVTGGLTFAGGPWNNYSSHAIASMMTALRDSPGVRGLVTANGGYLTKHAIAVYSTEPPPRPYRHVDVQSDVDATPTTNALETYEGPGTIESWTVAYGRDGAPERGFAAVRTPDGARTLAGTTDADQLAAMLATDVSKAKVVVNADASFRVPS